MEPVREDKPAMLMHTDSVVHGWRTIEGFLGWMVAVCACGFCREGEPTGQALLRVKFASFCADWARAIRVGIFSQLNDVHNPSQYRCRRRLGGMGFSFGPLRLPCAAGSMESPCISIAGCPHARAAAGPLSLETPH